MALPNLDTLTPREREVLKYIAEGDSLLEIAQKLYRSLKTIETHRLALGKKLKASNRVELTRIAIANGLITVRPQSGARHAPGADQSAQPELGWIHQINEAIHNASAASFIQRFCNAASLLPGVRFSAICTPDPNRPEGPDEYHRFTIAASERGRMGDPRRHHAMNTPCEEIVTQGACAYADGVTKAYPNDAWLRQVQARGYVGRKLTGKVGSVVGAVVLIADQPLVDLQAYERVIDFFVPHVARALDDCLQLDTLRHRCDQLEVSRLPVAPGQDPVPRIDGACALAGINQELSALAGPAFMSRFVRSLCDRFGFEFAAVLQLDQAYASQTLRSLVFRANGEQVEPVCYQVKDTPCESVLQDGTLCVTHDVAERFPHSVFLTENGIEAFLGVRLSNAEGEIVGVCWAAAKRPPADPEAALGAMRSVAARLGAEVGFVIQLEVLRQEREWIRCELEGETDEHMLLS